MFPISFLSLHLSIFNLSVFDPRPLSLQRGCIIITGSACWISKKLETTIRTPFSSYNAKFLLRLGPPFPSDHHDSQPRYLWRLKTTGSTMMEDSWPFVSSTLQKLHSIHPVGITTDTGISSSTTSGNTSYCHCRGCCHVYTNLGRYTYVVDVRTCQHDICGDRREGERDPWPTLGQCFMG